MTKPQSEAERMASEYVVKNSAYIIHEQWIDPVRHQLIKGYLAGFKAAVEQGVRHSMDVPFHGITERHVKLSDLQKLLEPK